MIKVNSKGEITGKSHAFIKPVLAAVCYVVGHRYKLTRRISRSIAELRCPRCGEEFGINTDAHALLTLDDELRHLHTDMLLNNGS